MKIIPYLRFAWAGQIITDSWSYTSFTSTLGREGQVWDVFTGSLALTFVLYCLVMGIQELKELKLVEGKYFYIFGTLYELMIFLSGLYIIRLVGEKDFEIWRIGVVMFWNIVLLTIIFLDIRKVWTN
jgi:hypothetical protein